ncbi:MULTISPECIES: type II toxin-antitoxin system RelE/ParE family toxin [unclassified Rhizobium]|uniref:type II toxin-antitoxin system RelE/ParE family toxin n=1 Tax=unclassified Rhizobium TaxID=2613769 RepID=UPI000CDF4287|nr:MULTISPECIES: type II toxin-antitoxin system RelE/ParE family toxin [Rhizobium]AVA23312.1 toxin-antitoxin system toxin RelE/ParE family protein [Rhizobium sp. NXC24]MDK4739701.1 type II toxin-antitoxin system RelE/ParE family toxin [Rhizobium sp. CNPSo 3464]UWU20660.1 type II toxin-antitoxin system RelE/ParE family toxin [Rhizobium tropici]
MKKLIFSPKAASDIDQIYDYTEEKWGYQQAEDYVFAMRDRCHALLNGTARGRKVGGIRSDYLALAYGSHFIIYKDGVQTLTIVPILHRRMNIGAHL